MRLSGYNEQGVEMVLVAYRYGISKKSIHPVSDLLVKVGKRKFVEIMIKEGVYDSRSSYR